MISEKEILWSASVLIRERNDEAEQEAAEHAEFYRKKGDAEGEAVWLRIKAAVVEMQKKAPGPDDTIQ